MTSGPVHSTDPAAGRPRSRQAAARGADGRHVAAVLCGALGLFAFNLVLGPIAVGLGATAARRAGPGSRQRRAGVVGLVLGVADVALLVAFLLPGIGHGGVVWRPGF